MNGLGWASWGVAGAALPNAQSRYSGLNETYLNRRNCLVAMINTQLHARSAQVKP